MITVICDMCGEKLNSVNNLVEVNLEYNGVVTLKHGVFHNTKRQLCITCATRLLNWIRDHEGVE